MNDQPRENAQERVLVVGAHPDDFEFMCAGTVTLLGEAGYSVEVATMTLGDAGSAELSPSEIQEVRRAEAEKACRTIGAKYHYVGFHDFGVFVDDASNRRVTALLREVDPTLVFTHPPADYLSDHEMTSRLVRNACFASAVRNYDTSSFSSVRRSSGVPFLFYAQPIEGVDILGNRVRPHFYIDISEKMDLKRELLACHDSQRAWLRAHHGMDEYLASMERWARQMGQEASEISGRTIRFAEGFQQHRGHAYPSENRLQTVLGERVIGRDS